MNQHTPGPWRVGDRDERDVAAYLIVADKGASSLPCIPGTANGCDLEHALANARLIAAAPEMKAFIGAIASGVHQSPNSMSRWQESARALLAKIEGGE